MTTNFSIDEKIALLEAASIVTVDTEGYLTKEHPLMAGFSAAFDGLEQGIYFPISHSQGNLTTQQLKKVYTILEQKEALVAHNMMHDINVLKKSGFHHEGKFYCTMLMAHWIDEELFDYSLNAISKRYGGQPKAMPPQMSLIIESDGWNAVPVAWMDEYSSNDALITHKLFRKELPEFQAQGFDDGLWDRETTFIREVIIPMKERGIKTDLGFCVKEYMRGQAIMDDCIKEMGFKPSSPKALEKFLIDELGLPVISRTPTGRVQFNKDAMEQYDLLLEKKDDERAKTILRFRGWQKTNSSNYKAYLNLCDEQGVLHPSYNLHRTVTHRLSCSEPNLQQIPKTSDKDWNGGLKRAFVPREGFKLWSVDYSQLQFRMTVAYAGEHSLIDIFNDPKRDIFQEMATQMNWLRQDVKTLVYLILFGGGGTRASVAFGVSKSQGYELVKEFHSQFPAIKRCAKRAENAARQQGYVRTWAGSKRHFKRGAAYYRALNAVIQGGEAEIIKSAMILIAQEVCDKNCYLLLQIHDEIVPEIREGMEDIYLPKIKECMIRATEEFNDYVDYPVAFTVSASEWGKK